MAEAEKGKKTEISKADEETFGGDAMFITLVEAMISQLYNYVKTYQNLYFKYIQYINI